MLAMSYRMDRRSFIIAGGLTALASTRVLGANDTLRIGVIGAGRRMKGLLDSADKLGPYDIVAVSDVYGPNRDAVKERSNGLATTHLDYHEVLAKDIDAVIIASPDAQFSNTTVPSAEAAGKWIAANTGPQATVATADPAGPGPAARSMRFRSGSPLRSASRKVPSTSQRSKSRPSANGNTARNAAGI